MNVIANSQDHLLNINYLFENVTYPELCLEVDLNAAPHSPCDNCSTPGFNVWLFQTLSRTYVVSSSLSSNSHMVIIWDNVSQEWLQTFVFLAPQLVNCSVIPHDWPLPGAIVNPVNNSPCPPAAPPAVVVVPVGKPVAAPTVPVLAPVLAPPVVIVPPVPLSTSPANGSTNGTQTIPPSQPASTNQRQANLWPLFTLLVLLLAIPAVVLIGLHRGWFRRGHQAETGEEGPPVAFHTSGIYRAQTTTGENPLYVEKRE